MILRDSGCQATMSTCEEGCRRWLAEINSPWTEVQVGLASFLPPLALELGRARVERHLVYPTIALCPHCGPSFSRSLNFGIQSEDLCRRDRRDTQSDRGLIIVPTEKRRSAPTQRQRSQKECVVYRGASSELATSPRSYRINALFMSESSRQNEFGLLSGGMSTASTTYKS